MRADEREELIACGLDPDHLTEEAEQYLAFYRRSMRWAWITAGLNPADLQALHEPHLRRVFKETMGYELPA